MSTHYCCRNEHRRQLLATSSVALNGIDYLEVLDRRAPEEALRQRTLLVTMLKPEPWGLEANNVRLEGGVRITNIQVEWALRAAAAAEDLVEKGQITPAEQAFLADLPNADRVLVVRTNMAGDFSSYRLRLVKSGQVSVHQDDEPPAHIDPVLSSVEFSFKVECPNEFDCNLRQAEPAGPRVEPVIDYLSKDFASFRRLMLERLAVTMPDWQERSPADVGVALVEVMAYAADYLSYYQDAVATEAYLGTARQRASVRRHARLLDYAMHDGCNARTWVHVEVSSEVVELNQGARLLTAVPGFGPKIAETEYVQALSYRPVVFETMHKALLFAAHNDAINFYTWGEQECWLPKGATTATLRDSTDGNGRLRLRSGDVLVFQENSELDAWDVNSVDSKRRWAVRLTAVRPEAIANEYGKRTPGPLRKDPLLDQPIVEIEWAAEDALPFPFCLSAANRDEEAIENVGVALGNMVLADHGATVMEQQPLLVPNTERFRPILAETEITHHTACADVGGRLPDGPATKLLQQDPRQAQAAIKLREGDEWWWPRRDLLASSRYDCHFVAEIANDGRTQLRFGDGIYGRRPAVGVALAATYRVGNGRRGNVGQEALQHIVTDNGLVKKITNPLPAQSGIDPESMDEVRLYAPQAFHVQERAVTAQDYAEMAQRHPQIQRAAAVRRWTGSWFTVFITVDRLGGLPVDTEFEAELRRFLDHYRLAGQDLEIEGPRYVPIEVTLTVCVRPGYFRSHVKAALLAALGSTDLTEGRRGYFHPDNFTFGQPVYLSPIVAAAMQIPGVSWVDTDPDPAKPNRFRRWGHRAQGELARGQIDIGSQEIARLDNDPNMPENGVLNFIMQGGL